ncbi:peptidase-related protein [Amycolatopsis mediterranei S699]|uniref:Peptidase-related protein n=2 Tax=Amycolatopsis mediterranei TaxID=33910 RepID=A0A0H3D780_AMYMU|nr:peptidase-related protein [Amycolatopsis mediterranei U32]AEK43632.1 peptidase-related protein [Amycolatopsis mediterranei S699]AGT85664.1 peptidase-related protein [Amycolatopsis mediterranei RB]KDO04742.1 peptidase [Amycolatopsis mediterranei]AFO78536.1 peptidase-related protein [Amycolatopsis mediterranei S699]
MLNQALADQGTGLFADVDVTLLPEATSNRAVRALGAFFTKAHRDDVLLLYFSGHGKLDQLGRLHLCMHDTETTDLLSTAVSSMRINEFVEASRARNVVIILDCCYAGAFRGGGLGDAVAGPGRYVMTSCRGTQLANDASVDNGTSFFTQHLIEGLLYAADQDGDGYVSFSDVYAYVDRCLREDGKQIPQRRVDGDGDLHLARRQQAGTAAGNIGPAAHPADGAGADQVPPSTVVPPVSIEAVTSPTRRQRGWSRRRIAIVAAAAAGVIAAGVAAAVLLVPSGDSGDHAATPGSGSYTATAPWRIRVDGTGYGNGCTVTLTDTASGEAIPVPGNIYSVAQYQIDNTGSFKWQANDRNCFVTPFAGSGTAVLPFTQEQNGDTDAFLAPDQGVVVQVKDNNSGICTLRLLDATNGQELDVTKWAPGMGAVTLNPQGRTQVYIFDSNCVIQVSAHT